MNKIVESLVPDTLVTGARELCCILFGNIHQRQSYLVQKIDPATDTIYRWAQVPLSEEDYAKVQNLLAAREAGTPVDQLVNRPAWDELEELDIDAARSAFATLQWVTEVDPDALPLDPPDHVVISTMGLRSVYALETYEAPPPPSEPELEPEWS